MWVSGSKDIIIIWEESIEGMGVKSDFPCSGNSQLQCLSENTFNPGLQSIWNSNQNRASWSQGNEEGKKRAELNWKSRRKKKQKCWVLGFAPPPPPPLHHVTFNGRTSRGRQRQRRMPRKEKCGWTYLCLLSHQKGDNLTQRHHVLQARGARGSQKHKHTAGRWRRGLVKKGRGTRRRRVKKSQKVVQEIRTKRRKKRSKKNSTDFSFSFDNLWGSITLRSLLISSGKEGKEWWSVGKWGEKDDWAGRKRK